MVVSFPALLAEREEIAKAAVLDRVGVGSGATGDDIEEWEVLDLLAQLVQKSLVDYEEAGGEGRYRLLETVRQYAGRECGALFTPGNVEELRGWIARLVADPGIVDRWRQELPPVQGLAAHAEAIEAVYAEVLAGRRGR